MTATTSSTSSTTTRRKKILSCIDSGFFFLMIMMMCHQRSQQYLTVQAFAPPVVSTTSSRSFAVLSLSNLFPPSSSSSLTTTTTRCWATPPSTSSSSSSSSVSEIQQRRQTLLSRKGPYFDVDKTSGAIEFGSTIQLTTTLLHDNENDNDNQYQETDGRLSLISDWLLDEKRVACSIWDKDKTVELGDGRSSGSSSSGTTKNSLYQLQVMKLSFVTLSLQPTVDVRMWTQRNAKGIPVFYLQSVGFDPNLSILPGTGPMNTNALGITIEVVGQLMPTIDQKGVTGKIAFTTRGTLPPPLRLIPTSVLQAASNQIQSTVSDFAIASFQKGATQSFQEYVTAVS